MRTGPAPRGDQYTMSENEAQVDIVGAAAHEVAKGFLDNTSMNPEDINLVELFIAVKGHEFTDISIEAYGPLAGKAVTGMVSAIDFSEITVEELKARFIEDPAEVEARDDNDDFPPGVGAAGTGGETREIHPLDISVDTEEIEFPSGTPQSLQRDTVEAKVLSEFVRYCEAFDVYEVTPPTLYEESIDIEEPRHASYALSKMFRERNLIARRLVVPESTWMYSYVLTKEGLNEYERLTGDAPSSLGASDSRTADAAAKL